MKKELVIRSNSSAVDFALLNSGKLIELNKEIDSNKFSVGDIFISSIRKPVAGLNAAFINVGYHKDGFLHYHDLGPRLSSVLKFVSLIQKGKKKDYLLCSANGEKSVNSRKKRFGKRRPGTLSDLLSFCCFTWPSR